MMVIDDKEIQELEKGVDEALRLALFESWMSESDYNEAVKMTFALVGSSKYQLIEKMKIGVSNGHSIDEQLRVLKNVLK